MNTEETVQILAILKAAYPESYKHVEKRDGLAMVKLWQSMFARDAYTEVSAAVLALIATRTVGYSPTIGEVKEQMQKYSDANMLTEQQAWSLVSKACENGYYGYKKEFDKLPPEVQRAVGRPEQLKDWSVVDVDTFNTVIASNFMRSYRTQQTREKERAMLPDDVRKAISGIADNLIMPESCAQGMLPAR